MKLLLEDDEVDGIKILNASDDQKQNMTLDEFPIYKFIGKKGQLYKFDPDEIVMKLNYRCKDGTVKKGSFSCGKTPEERKKMFEEMQKSMEKGKGSFEISSPHMQNFVDSVRSRKKPIAPIEVGASTAILCCLGNMATELQRTVKWNPATLSFGDDKEAWNHRLYHYEYRNPYKL